MGYLETTWMPLPGHFAAPRPPDSMEIRTFDLQSRDHCWQITGSILKWRTVSPKTLYKWFLPVVPRSADNELTLESPLHRRVSSYDAFQAISQPHSAER